MNVTIKCPTCGKTTRYSAENPSRPFCCERCRLIDLGEWAGGERRLPAEPVDPDQLDELSDK